MIPKFGWAWGAVHPWFEISIDFNQWMVGVNFYHNWYKHADWLGFPGQPPKIELIIGTKVFNIFILCVRIGFNYHYERNVPL